MFEESRKFLKGEGITHTCNVNFVKNVDRGINDHADECECKPEDYERTSSSGVIGSKGEDQEHHCATDVRSHGIQISFDGGVSKTSHDLWKEERNRLQWYAKADFNGQKSVGSWLPEDFE